MKYLDFPLCKKKLYLYHMQWGYSHVRLDAPWAYTRLPVVRVTQKQKTLSWVVLHCSVPVNFSKWGIIKTIWGVTQTSCQQRLFAWHVHTFNYFVMSCPILRSFTFSSFGNKFSSKIKRHALEWISLVSSLKGLCHAKWYNSMIRKMPKKENETL